MGAVALTVPSAGIGISGLPPVVTAGGARDSIRRQISRALTLRATVIRTAAGYETDAGARVAAYPQAMPCVVVRAGELRLLERLASGSYARWASDFFVEAMAEQDDLDIEAASEALLADLVRGLLTGDETLGGIAEQIDAVSGNVAPREDGGALAGAQLVLRVIYWAGYADPYTVMT